LALDQTAMTPREAAGATPSAPLTAIVVEPTLADIWFAVSGLANSGFHITVAESFLEARTLIDKQPPAVLITDIRLHEYNGLHLVLRGKAARPDMAAIVVTTVADPVLQAEAERMNATFILKPTTRQEFLAAVCRTLFRSSEEAAPIRPSFERRIVERRFPEKAIVGAERRTAERRRNFGTAPTSNVLTN
jgi:DNA-binding NtrC family response regulator